MKPWIPKVNERGFALITTFLFMSILSVLGTSAYLSTSNERHISSNYRSIKQAFYDAEAGINYTHAQIEASLAGGTLSLSGDPVNVSYAIPSGFSFTPPTALNQVSGSIYKFQVSSNAGGGSSTLEVTFSQDPAMEFGIFADEELDMKNSGTTYSYNSSTVPNPTPSDSTGEGDVGSNESIIVHNGTVIDGDVGLGEDSSGNDATVSASGTPIINGEYQDVGAVNPDPLGAVGGSLASTFTSVESSNDNASAGSSPGDTDTISSNTINLGNGDQITLTAGDYYLTDIDLGNGSSLIIDTSSGPVNIYLAGGLDAKNGSAININGATTEFSIFSNSTDSIVFKNSSTFKGVVYAPYASLEMKNSSDVYGQLWANKVDIKNSGQFYFDVALKDKYKSNTISLHSWRDTRY